MFNQAPRSAKAFIAAVFAAAFGLLGIAQSVQATPITTLQNTACVVIPTSDRIDGSGDHSETDTDRLDVQEVSLDAANISLNLINAQ